MAIPSEMISMEHFMHQSTITCGPELLEPKINVLLSTNQPVHDEAQSGLAIKKKASLSIKTKGLSNGLNVRSVNSPGYFGEFFTPGSGRPNLDQPSSALGLRSGCRLFEDEDENEYLSCYDRGDKFLDQLDFKIVEPGAENKVRKHIKVLTRSQSLLDQSLDSPLYVGSPSLKGIGDSSLLARRTNSRTESPMSVNSPAEDSPLNLHKFSTPNRNSAPQKMSRFGESSKKMSIDSVSPEEEKLHISNEGHGHNRSPLRHGDGGHIRKPSTIQEVAEPHTPSNDVGNLKNLPKVL